MSERIAEFLRARYRDCEALALNHDQPSASWQNFDMDGELRDDYNAGTVAFVPRHKTRAHIARHDPVSVLTDLDSKRAMLDDLLSEKHAVIEDDNWFTCAQATEERDGGATDREDMQGQPCDCGRDYRVRRRLLILARPYIQHPDYPAACDG